MALARFLEKASEIRPWREKKLQHICPVLVGVVVPGLS